MSKDSISVGAGPGRAGKNPQDNDAIRELAHEAPPADDLAVDASLNSNEGVRKSPVSPVSPAANDAGTDTASLDDNDKAKR